MKRLRFAPSPSGSIHIGNARTALFNWLLARHEGGTFILRIEDTDSVRSSADAEESIYEDLRWLGLDWDEGPVKGGEAGPYRQSERLDLYRNEAQKLVERGLAYPCFCTAAELEEKRRLQVAGGLPVKYDGSCAELPAGERERRIAGGAEYSIRFRIPAGAVSFTDMVLGDIEVDTGTIGDLIIIRSDGRAAYNFAVVIDDHLMGITDVIRGNDHLSNTPKQLLIYRALGAAPPAFGHVPLITGKTGAPLSKRDAATSVAEYRRMGVLPEALIDYLSLLGWSHPSGEEILGFGRLIEGFDGTRIQKSAASFDLEKLKWLNGNYIRRRDGADLGRLLSPYLAEAGLSPRDERQLALIAETMKGNLELLSDAPAWARLVIGDAPEPADEPARSWLASDVSRTVFREFLAAARTAAEIDEHSFYELLKAVQEKTKARTKEIMMPMRVALTGITSGPDLKKIAEIIGLEECRKRIQRALGE